MSADKQPFTGRHLVNVRLTRPGSEKITRHHEIALDGAPVTYLPGDALGALPANDPALVERVIRAIGATGDEPVTGPDGATLPLHRALSTIYNLNNPSRRLLEFVAAHNGADVAPLLDRANAEALKHYLSGWNEAHDVLDVLESHPQARPTPADLVGCLRKNLPRLYSVASSLRAHADQVHLLVVSVR